MTDIVDAKLRYPHTSLLFIQFDSKLFDEQNANVTVEMKGIIVRVPENYDPVTRTYSGTWTESLSGPLKQPRLDFLRSGA